MRLTDLLAGDDTVSLRDREMADSLEISGLTSDSREVRDGYLFAAFPGAKSDGRGFIADALKRGAAAILVPQGSELPEIAFSVAVVESRVPRKTFALMAANMYERQPQVIAAVTGSNGKTSTAQFARQIWQRMDHAAASLGTLGVSAPGVERGGALTTPDPVTLHMEIAELEAAGVTHLAMEASSHGLDQYRLDGVRVTAAGFTNITRDHLDYHGTMEAYLAAKTRLFTDILTKGGVAVLNADIPEYNLLRNACAGRGHRVFSYGYGGEEIQIINRVVLSHSQLLEIQLFGEGYAFELPLVGEFQVYNALCALGLVIAEFSEDRLHHMEAVHALEKLDGVRGRLELVAIHPNGAPVYVDYAHTPDALENVLKTLRPHVQGDLVAIIGCGGDRDTGKRPQMGAISARLADRTIVTDDNPRSEDPADIRKAVMDGCPKATEIGDRRAAIRAAVARLEPRDTLVITGKGHEQGQIIGDEVRPFDDATEARNAVAEVKA